jgi:hypothetical protein
MVPSSSHGTFKSLRYRERGGGVQEGGGAEGMRQGEGGEVDHEEMVGPKRASLAVAAGVDMHREIAIDTDC